MNYLRLRNVIILILFCFTKQYSQDDAWRVNPKVLTDTIDLIIVSQGTVEPGRIMDFLVADDGKFWFASYDYGLINYDFQESNYRRVIDEKGVAAGAWCALKLTPDERGFWLGTTQTNILVSST